MQFTAILGGKIVEYNSKAQFRVDRRKPGRGNKWEEYDVLPSISEALSIYHANEGRGYYVKLVAVHGKGRKTLCKTGR